MRGERGGDGRVFVERELGVGLGTVLYAVSIGPLVHALLPRMTVAQPAPATA